MKKRILSSPRNLQKQPALTSTQIRAFRKKIYDHYRQSGRDLPWRKTRNPYRILVSEIMLQQTQVDRVIEKYKEFLAAFPDFSSLARAPLRKLLGVWQGMGYNRRALLLKSLAQAVMKNHKGKLPSDQELLLAFPGIGNYTAGAVLAFAFNQPVLCMDTNIRRVYIHTFFGDKDDVHDADIIPILEQTLDTANPRDWYNALMDFGAMLKKEHANPNRRSAHYTRQSPFENSNRQVRGMILKALVKESPLTTSQMMSRIAREPDVIKKNLVQLEKEGFIRKKGRDYFI